MSQPKESRKLSGKLKTAAGKPPPSKVLKFPSLPDADRDVVVRWVRLADQALAKNVSRKKA